MSRIRSRLTTRVNRARIKLELRRSLLPLAFLGVASAAGLLAWAFLLGNVGKPDAGSSMLRGGTYQVRFTVDDARSARGNRAYVRFKGIPAGKVVEDELVDGRPVLTVRIYKTFGPLYRDARAALRPTSALENMYLDIVDRGTPGAGLASAGGPLPAGQTETGVHIARALQVFEPDVRASLSRLATDLGKGLADNGAELGEAFARTIPFVRAADRMTRQLGEREGQTRRLVSSLAALSDELARRDRDVRALLTEGGRTMKILAAGSQDLGATIAQLPPTLRQVRTSLDATRSILPRLDRALTGLAPVAERLPASLGDLRGVSDDARPAVAALQRPVRSLIPLAAAASPAARSLQRATTALRPQVGALDHVTRTIAGCPLAPYGFFQWTPSVFSLQDARGVTVRGDLTLGIDTVNGTPDPNVYTPRSCAPGVPYPARTRGER